MQQLAKAKLDQLVAEQRSASGISRTGRSARTVSRMLVVLGQALDAAVRERLVTVNVAALVNLPTAVPVVIA